MRSRSPCSITCKSFILATLATLVLIPNHALAGRLLQSDGGFKTWNDTIADAISTLPERRSTLGFGESAPVTVTFYSSPGMDCATGNGMCGYGTDTSGDTDFVKNSLYPLHVASGNFGLLSGCGGCGVLSYNGKTRGYVVTDVTDPIDELGQRSWPPQGSHIDMCCNEFDYFQSLKDGSGNINCNNGGIFTGTWTRVPCETLGSPNYPHNDHFVVRTEAWNRWAKAIVPSRLHGVGEVSQVDFETRNGGFHKGEKVAGWGSWWIGGNLSGQGGVNLIITMADGSVVKTVDYPLPDYDLWETGSVFDIPYPTV